MKSALFRKDKLDVDVNGSDLLHRPLVLFVCFFCILNPLSVLWFPRGLKLIYSKVLILNCFGRARNLLAAHKAVLK